LNYEINSIILRIPNIYGPVNKKENLKRSVINFIISKAILEGELSLFRNKKCLRDYVYIEDILEAFYLSGLVENKYCDGNFYVIGSGFKGTIEDVCNQIKIKLGDVKINLDDKYVLEPMEFRNYTGDNSLFKEVSNWEPKVKIDQGLDLTIKFLKKGNLAKEVLPL
jgi:nucleoside-diphosphate-sugar epimerase